MPPCRALWPSLLLVSACGPASPTAPTSYDVAYHLNGTVGVTFDSVTYEDAQGALVRVVGPAVGWSVAFPVMVGRYVRASAWGHALSGQSATLKVTWTVSGVSTASDSSRATLSAAGGFTLDIARRRL